MRDAIVNVGGYFLGLKALGGDFCLGWRGPTSEYYRVRKELSIFANSSSWDLLNGEYQDLNVGRRETMALHFENFILEYVVKEVVPVRVGLFGGRLERTF